MNCCLCREGIAGHGNNPEPIRQRGKCCDYCNSKFVIPVRLKRMKAKIKFEGKR